MEDLTEGQRRELIDDPVWGREEGLVEVDGRVWTWDELHERWDRGYGVLDGAETIYGMKAVHCPGDAVGETGDVIFPAECESVWWRLDVCSEPGNPNGDCSECGGWWMGHSSAGKAGCAAGRPPGVWKSVNVFSGADPGGVFLTGGDRFVACPETAAWAVRRWTEIAGPAEPNWEDVLRVSGIGVFMDGDGEWRQHNGHLLDGEEDADDIELYITVEDRYAVLAWGGPPGLDCTWIPPRPARSAATNWGNWEERAAEAKARGDYREQWAMMKRARLEDDSWPEHPRDRAFHTIGEIAAMDWSAGVVREIVGMDGRPLLRDGRRRSGMSL